MEMKDGNLRRHAAGFDQGMILQCASGAKTSRADISTSIAFDAFPKLSHPILEAFFFGKALHFLDIRDVFYGLGQVPLFHLGRVRSITAATIC